MPFQRRTPDDPEAAPKRRRKPRKAGPYSRVRGGIKGLDKRTKAARHIAKHKADLIAHIGRTPSFTEMAIIDRASVLSLRIALMEAQTGPGGEMTEKNSRELLCWVNAYCRLMTQLGLEATPARVQDTRSHLERLVASIGFIRAEAEATDQDAAA